jgi:hypothetical protein
MNESRMVKGLKFERRFIKFVKDHPKIDVAYLATNSNPVKFVRIK